MQVWLARPVWDHRRLAPVPATFRVRDRFHHHRQGWCRRRRWAVPASEAAIRQQRSALVPGWVVQVVRCHRDRQYRRLLVGLGFRLALAVCLQACRRLAVCRELVGCLRVPVCRRGPECRRGLVLRCRAKPMAAGSVMPVVARSAVLPAWAPAVASGLRHPKGRRFPRRRTCRKPRLSRTTRCRPCLIRYRRGRA